MIYNQHAEIVREGIVLAILFSGMLGSIYCPLQYDQKIPMILGIIGAVLYMVCSQ